MATGERTGTLALVAAVLAACLLSLFTGCGSAPQVDGQDRQILVSLATAISARNPDWLAANERLVEQRKAQGQLSDPAYRALTQIITQARAGQWSEAETAILALRDGQEPSAEDRQSTTERRLDHVGRTLGEGRGR